MVVAVSSWPRRSSSAHRICIRRHAREELRPEGHAATPAPRLSLQPPDPPSAARTHHPKAPRSPRPAGLLAAIRPLRERPRGDTAAIGVNHNAQSTRHQRQQPAGHINNEHINRGASDRVWFFSRVCLINGRLRRLCYIQPGFRSSAPRTHASSRQQQSSHAFTSNLAAHQGGTRYKGSPRPRLIPLPIATNLPREARSTHATQHITTRNG